MPILAPSASDITATVKAGAEVNAAVGGAVARGGNSAPPRAGGTAAASAAVTQSRAAQTSSTPIATIFRIPPIVLPVAWTPMQLPIRLWLDGSDPLGTGVVPAEDTVITSWKDKSGNARHAYAEGSPLLKTSTQNGLSTIRTQDGTGIFTPKSYFTVDIPSGFFANGFHFITVYRTWRSGAAPYTGFNTPINRQTTFNQYWNQRYVGNATIYTRTWNIDDALAVEHPAPNPLLTNAQKSAKTVIHQNIVVPTTSGKFGYSEFANGQLIPLDATTPGQTITYTDTETTLQIGWRPADNLRCNAYFCEILVFNSSVSTDDRLKAEGYLAWKWGLVSNLPVNHPYKAFSPIV